MALSLRPPGLRSPAFADWADYNVIEDGKVVGRIYEDRHTPAAYRWFWSVTAFHGDPCFGITTNARVPTLDEAKAQFREAWGKVCEATKQ
jgi:hypothetical protein